MIIKLDNYHKTMALVGLQLIYLFFRMTSYFSGGIINEMALISARLMIILLMIFGMVLTQKVRFNRLTIIAIIFWMITIMGVLFHFEDLTLLVLNIIDQSFWFVSFIYYMNSLPLLSVPEGKKMIKFLCISYFFFLLAYGAWLLSSNRYWSAGGINSVYYVILLVPFMFVCPYKCMKLAIVITAGLVTILSAKRTAMIALVLCVVIPLLLENENRRKKRASIIFLICTVLVILLSLNYVSKVVDITIFDRFSTLLDDGGSGRLDTYKIVWQEFKDSSFNQQIFGHGYNAVYLNHISKSSAHNDFLEILYDYGVIGIMAYVAMLGYMVRHIRYLYRVRHPFKNMCLSGMIIYLIMSMFSHLIIYPTYIVFLLLNFSMGYMESQKKLAA